MQIHPVGFAIRDGGETAAGLLRQVAVGGRIQAALYLRAVAFRVTTFGQRNGGAGRAADAQDEQRDALFRQPGDGGTRGFTSRPGQAVGFAIADQQDGLAACRRDL